MSKGLYIAILLMASAAHAEKLTFPHYASLVEKHAAAQRLDPKMIWAVMGRESSGRCHNSPRGAGYARQSSRFERICLHPTLQR